MSRACGFLAALAAALVLGSPGGAEAAGWPGAPAKDRRAKAVEIPEAPSEPAMGRPSGRGGAPPAISSPTIASPYDLIRGTLPYSKDFTKVQWFGESLNFEVKWGIVSMGYASLAVPDVVDFGGQPAYHIVSRAWTTPFADKFYKVRDLNESWVHVGDLRSLGYSKRLREGKFFRDEWVIYDYPNKSFLSRRVNRDGSSGYEAGPVPGMVQDVLSSMFYIRPRRLKVGDEIVVDVNTKSNWPLVVKVLRKSRVRVPAGTFDCVVVEPFLRKEGIFIQKGKSLQVWLTDDERHMPVLMRVEILLGSISAYLLPDKK